MPKHNGQIPSNTKRTYLVRCGVVLDKQDGRFSADEHKAVKLPRSSLLASNGASRSGAVVLCAARRRAAVLRLHRPITGGPNERRHPAQPITIRH